MKAKIMLLAGLAGLSIASQAREFKSVDGNKTIKADFVRYDPRTANVTLKFEGGRTMVVPSSTFSADDINYFLDQQRAKEQKKAIKVDTAENSEREDNKRGNMLFKLKNTKLNFSISNSSDFDFDDLTLKYWVLVERANKKGEMATEVMEGSESVSSLPARGNVSVEGPTVKLVQSAVSASLTGCPKVAVAAAAIERERILGTKIQIVDNTGNEIFSKSSSNRITAELSNDKK